MWAAWAACAAGRKHRTRNASGEPVIGDYQSHHRRIPGVACRHWCAIDPAGFGVFFEALTLGAIEGAEAHEQVVSERVPVGFEFQLFTGPAFAFDIASIEFLETVDQPRLLLFKHLNVSIMGDS
jgi:hypothetical protein